MDASPSPSELSSPRKSASRQGRYRKTLFDLPALRALASQLEAALRDLEVLRRTGQITDPEFTAFGLVALLACRRSDAFQKQGRLPDNKEGTDSGPASVTESAAPTLDSLKPRLEKQGLPTQALSPFLGRGLSLRAFLTQTRWKGIPDAARLALLAWMDGRYPLRLCFDIPPGTVVFDQQKQGIRCVTFFLNSEEMTVLHHERDALSFVVHDLMHAHAFYADPVRMRQQIGFYHWLARAQDVPAFAGLLQDSNAFGEAWDYIMSDMNSYCGHLLKTLRAAIALHAPSGSGDGLWSEIALGSGLSADCVELFLKVNTPHWQIDDFLALERFCESLVCIRDPA